MKIAILTDKPKTTLLANKENYLEDLQKKQTVSILKKVLSSKKFDCIALRADANIIQKLRKENVDLVFNLSNGLIGNSRQAQIPAILEFAGIPYTGSSILGHTLAINKNYSCKIFQSLNIPTPDFISVYSEKDFEKIDFSKLSYPLLVKPCDEGSGRGIQQDSLVFDKKTLKNKLKKNFQYTIHLY